MAAMTSACRSLLDEQQAAGGRHGR